jgi:hypothetical protein
MKAIEAALYFDSLSADNIVARLRPAPMDRQLRGQVCASVRQRATQYTRERAVTRTWDIHQPALNQAAETNGA